MNLRLLTVVILCSLSIVSNAVCQDKKGTVAVGSNEVKHVVKATKEGKSSDTLVIIARLLDIPGALPPNDLYNYVYIMKYRVLSVEKGSYKGQEILVGHYNPLIPRSQVKDKMDSYVNGTVQKFEAGAKHLLKLVQPVESVWKDAVEDEFIDIDSTKYFAIGADIVK